MSTIVKNVRDIEAADRAALEHVVGGKLREDQRVIIQVVGAVVPAGEAQTHNGVLPDWCNVYEGLTDEEVDRIEQSIVRTPGSRTFG